MAVQSAPAVETARLWEQVLQSVKSRIDSLQAFETWFMPIVPVDVGPQVVQLEVPNSFFVDWIHEHHLPLLRSSLTEVLGSTPELRFVSGESVAVPAAPRPAASPTRPQADPGRSSAEGQLIPRLTFE